MIIKLIPLGMHAETGNDIRLLNKYYCLMAQFEKAEIAS